MDHDAHVEDFYAYQDAMDWQEACAQMREAEGIWEDNGCSWPSQY